MRRKNNNKKHKKNSKIISAKEIMDRYDISYQTVNHYTDFGLLPIKAKKGNVRFYDKHIVENRLKKMRMLMREGYSLRLIRKQLLGI